MYQTLEHGSDPHQRKLCFWRSMMLTNTEINYWADLVAINKVLLPLLMAQKGRYLVPIQCPEEVGYRDSLSRDGRVLFVSALYSSLHVMPVTVRFTVLRPSAEPIAGLVAIADGYACDRSHTQMVLLLLPPEISRLSLPPRAADEIVASKSAHLAVL